MGWEDEIGSIRAGKRADFAVFDEDPAEVPVSRLGSVRVRGTVFEGELRLLE